MERRYLKSELRVAQDGDSSPKITGYAALFDSPSDPNMPWSESIAPGAFDDVLATNPDVRCLFNHDDSNVLGRTKSGTLQLSVDQRGLRYVCDPPDTQVARDLMTSMKRGDIDQSSFGFIVGDDDWDEDANGNVTRRINSIRMLSDVSPVTFPAYPDATSGVRSLPASMPIELRSRFEKRDEADSDNNNGCHCQCPECVADDCVNCSDPDCDDPDCLANQRGHKHGKRALLPDQCTCTCAQCMAGSCGICSSEPRCMGAERNSIKAWRDDAILRLRLAEAE